MCGKEEALIEKSLQKLRSSPWLCSWVETLCAP